MTNHERELYAAERELYSLPRDIRETKRRGRKLQSARNKVRRAKAWKEAARRACLSLPKPWWAYRAKHGRGIRLRYARPEVEAMNNAENTHGNALDSAARAKQRYDERIEDRAFYRKRLRELSTEIDCLKSLVEIEQRKAAVKKPKKTDWRSRWEEVAPDCVVKKSIIRKYLATLDVEPPRNVWGGFCVFSHGTGYLKLPVKTWHQAELCRR